MYNNDIFEDLFVLEAASNHWGSVERGLKLVNEYAKIIRFNSVRAAIKFQFRDYKKIIHKDYRHRTDIRYIKIGTSRLYRWKNTYRIGIWTSKILKIN